MDHIRLNLGNIVIITGVSLLGGAAVLAGFHYLSNKDIPVFSGLARGSNDFLASATTAGK